MSRIGLKTPIKEIPKIVAQGNPIARQVCKKVVIYGGWHDPDSHSGGIASLLQLDSMGFTGEEIVALWQICQERTGMFLAVMRAWQLGFIRESELKEGIRLYSSGEAYPMLVPPELALRVRERLPRFKLTLPFEVNKT